MENITLVAMSTTRDKDMQSTGTRMERLMRACMMMERGTVKALTHISLVLSTKAIGQTIKR